MRELFPVLIEMHKQFSDCPRSAQLHSYEVAGAVGSVKIIDKNNSSVVLNWKQGLQ